MHHIILDKPEIIGQLIETNDITFIALACILIRPTAPVGYETIY